MVEIVKWVILARGIKDLKGAWLDCSPEKTKALDRSTPSCQICGHCKRLYVACSPHWSVLRQDMERRLDPSQKHAAKFQPWVSRGLQASLCGTLWGEINIMT